MKLLSFKAIIFRYLLAVILITLAGIISNPSDFFIIIFVAIVSLKLLTYDGIAAALSAKFPSFKIYPWLFIGYGLAVAGDMYFTYGAGEDGTDAGFAFLGTIMVTPWILAAALAVMIAATFLSRKK